MLWWTSMIRRSTEVLGMYRLIVGLLSSSSSSNLQESISNSSSCGKSEERRKVHALPSMRY